MRTTNVCVCMVVFLAMASSVKARPQESRAQQTKQTDTSAARPNARAQAEEPEQGSAVRLPVRRVVLYKSGVGYFEHLGRVQGDQNVTIDFTSGQLNDVLQTLTVLDLNGGQIAGVSYNSDAPLGQRLGTLRLPLAEKTDIAQFYGALRGARLEIRNGSETITGRLLSVERKTRVSGGTTLEVDLATLVSDTGEVRSVELTPAVTVRLLDHEVGGEVGSYLSLLSSERQQDLRRMTIAANGTGARQLYVSYISEVPVWKTSYRIVLPSQPGDQALLQGWAIVDNTVGEDWNDVELSLVAGAPQSFIEQLSQPYYARRPVVPLPASAQLMPQTHESAIEGGLGALSGSVLDPSGAVIAGAQVKLFGSSGELVGSISANGQGKYNFGDLPAGNYRMEVSSPGFKTSAIQGLDLGGGRENTQNVTLGVGSTTETVTVQATPNSIETETSEAVGEAGNEGGPNTGRGNELGGLAVDSARGIRKSSGGMVAALMAPSQEWIASAREAAEVQAEGTDLGDLFEYKLKDRVTVHKNESALVPIVQTKVSAEKVSLWNASLGSERPLRALWLTNSSPLTLDGGSFSVLENETFAGEGLTDSIKPGEKRLLTYAADLGVRVYSKSENDPQQVTQVHIAHGMMVQTRQLRSDTTYTVRNDDTTPRTVVVEHPLRPNWTMDDGGVKPSEMTSTTYRFRVEVEPKDTQKLEVRESAPVEARFQLTNLTSDQIALFVRQKSITPEVQTALQKIMDQKNRVAALNDEVSKRDDERQQIFDDQQRLRENLKALKGSAEERALTERYTQQLADQENRLAALQKESDDLSAQRDKAQQELNALIEGLTIDVAI